MAAAAAGIAAEVLVVVWRLMCGRSNGKDSGAATATEPQQQRWIYGGNDGAEAEIFKRRIVGGGDNLAEASGIAATVVVVARLIGNLSVS